MNIERHDDMLFPELADNGVRICCYLSDMVEKDDDLDRAMAAWGNGYEEVNISTYFPLSAVLSSAIERYQMLGGAIDPTEQPFFAALRAELLAMVEQIDGLRFGTPNAVVKRPLADEV